MRRVLAIWLTCVALLFTPALACAHGIVAIDADQAPEGLEGQRIGKLLVIEAQDAPTGASIIQPAVARALADPQYTNQWALGQFGAESLNVAGHTGAGQTVAVLDSGYSAPSEGSAAITAGYNMIASSANTADDHGHGTRVASIIAAPRDGIGMQGLAPDASIMPVKVLNSAGSGDTLTIASGIVWAADHGASVINLSLGAASDPGGAMLAAIRYAQTKGAVSVCASGNSGYNYLVYPAAYAECIAVGAQERGYADRVVFSNYGPGMDLIAPGTQVLVPQSGSYAVGDGTSYAAPYVAATAALALAGGVAPANVASRLTSTALDVAAAGWDIYNGYGQVRPSAAVAGLAPDACPNLAGYQSSVPAGHLLVSKECLPDVCPNLNGIQVTTPSGYFVFVNVCERDVCPNLEGPQSDVPAGYIFSQGSCAVDVCSNLSGPQSAVPAGHALVGSECIADVCPNLTGVQTAPPAAHTLTGSSCELDACPSLAGHQSSTSACKPLTSCQTCTSQAEPAPGLTNLRMDPARFSLRTSARPKILVTSSRADRATIKLYRLRSGVKSANGACRLARPGQKVPAVKRCTHQQLVRSGSSMLYKGATRISMPQSFWTSSGPGSFRLRMQMGTFAAAVKLTITR